MFNPMFNILAKIPIGGHIIIEYDHDYICDMNKRNLIILKKVIKDMEMLNTNDVDSFHEKMLYLKQIIKHSKKIVDSAKYLPGRKYKYSRTSEERYWIKVIDPESDNV